MEGKRRSILLIISMVLFFFISSGAGAADLNLNPEERALHDQMMKAFVAPDFCGKSLVECPAKITVDMREGILQQIKEGATKEDIISHWVGVYGEKILAAPPKAGFFLSAWILPIIGIVAGVFILSGSLKGRMRRGKPSQPKKDRGPNEYEEELKEEILKHL